MKENNRPPNWYGIPRTEIYWWPTVQSCNCRGCGLSVLACPQEALAFDYKLRLPFINDTQSCVVGCTICGTIYPHDGMLFPPPQVLHKLVEKHRILEQTRKTLRSYWKRFGGLLPMEASG